MNQDWTNKEIILRSLLAEAQQHDVGCILLSNGFEDKHGQYEVLAGFGAKEQYETLANLPENQFCMGFCSYDLKNSFENLHSPLPKALNLPDVYFFEPINTFKWHRGSANPEINFDLPSPLKVSQEPMPQIAFAASTSRETYLANVDAIRDCIKRGDFYEMNYCLQFQADATVDPYDLFYRLNNQAPAPFAAFFKFHDHYLLCASPERFLARRGDKLIAQPIKGTRKRLSNPEEDNAIKEALFNSEKDRAENIMIVDLMRNDLSRVCKPGSVDVSELCGIYSYSHVHQMISTVTGNLSSDTGIQDILKATFPMGSMTGAPKIQVMKDIQRFEDFSRGWYSGSVGYLDKGAFDLNVVIRTMQYDAGSEKLYYHVGGAITYDSNGEEELAECMHKASGMLAALSH